MLLLHTLSKSRWVDHLDMNMCNCRVSSKCNGVTGQTRFKRPLREKPCPMAGVYSTIRTKTFLWDLLKKEKATYREFSKQNH